MLLKLRSCWNGLGPLVLVVFTAVLLTACGGGGGGDGSSNTTETGQLIDSAVAGVNYRTATQSGTTDAEGRFQYISGETVRFSIGDTVLGECPANGMINPFDLITGAAMPQTNLQVSQMLAAKNSPLMAVINLTVLLQTLDQDGDPANGIDISPEVAGLFSGVSIDFYQGPQQFRKDVSFRTVLNRANAENAFPAHRRVRDWGLAMNHLYASLAAEPPIFARVWEQLDSDLDGQADKSIRRTFDAEGRPLVFTRDDDGDGAVDYRETRQYDANGFAASFTKYLNGNTSIENYSWDADGNQISRDLDSNGDGVPDGRFISHYNEFGVLTQIDVDNQANGSTEGYIYYLYNAQGQTIEESIDQDGDGQKDIISKYYYTNGLLSETAYDADGDGIADITELFEVDANGNMTHYERNDNAAIDNLPDLIIDQQFDERGNVTRYERDDDGNGQPELIEDIRYDAQNNMSEAHIDTNGDGNFDEIATYDYDDHRNATAMYMDSDNDGQIDQQVTYTYQRLGWAYLSAMTQQ